MFLIVIQDYNGDYIILTKLNLYKCHEKCMQAVACFKWEAAKSENVFPMEKWSSAEAKLLAADLAPFVCAWLPPGSRSGYCRHILTERGGGANTASNSTLRKFSIIPQICKFVRFNRSFKSASVLQGFFCFFFFVYGSRKDARIQRKWDSRRFITSVTSLNRQSKQWDPNYKRGAWQYQKNKKSIRSARKPHST